MNLHSPLCIVLLVRAGGVLTCRANPCGTFTAEIVCRYGLTYGATDPCPLGALNQLERLLARELGAAAPVAAMPAEAVWPTALAIAADKAGVLAANPVAAAGRN